MKFLGCRFFLRHSLHGVCAPFDGGKVNRLVGHDEFLYYSNQVNLLHILKKKKIISKENTPDSYVYLSYKIVDREKNKTSTDKHRTEKAEYK